MRNGIGIDNSQARDFRENPNYQSKLPKDSKRLMPGSDLVHLFEKT
jgi:hypothetical protein